MPLPEAFVARASNYSLLVSHSAPQALALLHSCTAMSVLVSPSGQLDAASLADIQVDQDDTLAVVCALAAYGLQKTSLLDAVFGTSFASSESHLGVSVAVVEGEDSAVLAAPHNHVVVLDVEPYDGPDRSREEPRERAAHLSVALADVIFFVVRMNEIHRPDVNGVSALRSSLTEMLMMQDDGIIRQPNKEKRSFIVVVKDYESEVLTRQEIITGFLQSIHELYASLVRPSRCPQRVTELFEFEFRLLPSDKFQAEEFENALADMRSDFLDPAADNYLFEQSAYTRDVNVSLEDCAKGAWEKLSKEQAADIPNSVELMSTFDCGNVMRKVFEKYQRRARLWRRETDGGVIVENFGSAASKMVEGTIDVYDQDAASHKGSKAFKRKRDELKGLLDADLYGLFVTQIGKLREITYRLFKDKLDGIGDDEARLEKAVNNTLKESQKYFQVNAELLRPKNTSWRYDNDTKELSQQMREDATERLQRARLADYQQNSGRRGRRRRPGLGPGEKSRQPIQVSFHYLDPAPFGWKDSKYEKLSVDDNLEYSSNAPALGAGGGSGTSSGGLSVPLMPSRGSSWYQKNQDFIYSEKK